MTWKSLVNVAAFAILGIVIVAKVTALDDADAEVTADAEIDAASGRAVLGQTAYLVNSPFFGCKIPELYHALETIYIRGTFEQFNKALDVSTSRGTCEAFGFGKIWRVDSPESDVFELVHKEGSIHTFLVRSSLLSKSTSAVSP